VKTDETPFAQLFDRMEDLWERGDMAAADEIYADPIIQNGQPVGVAEIKRFVEILRAAFPDAHTDVTVAAVDDDTVVLTLHQEGTHLGRWDSRFGRIEPTGKRYAMAGIEIFRIGAGKVHEAWLQWDMLGLLTQLGATVEIPSAQAGPKSPE
jgi:predicted ester cyclase